MNRKEFTKYFSIIVMVFSCFSMGILFIIETSKVEIPVLMYHHFDAQRRNSTTVSTEEFNEQMSYLKEIGYQSITEKDIVDFYDGENYLPKKPVYLTIDDGYSSNYHLAYPILKKYGMKATIFTVISQVGDTPGAIPHFDWKQAKEMVDSGVISIQSHTYNMHHKEKDENGLKHAALKFKKTNETDDEYFDRIYYDLKTSKEETERMLGNEVVAFSYPFGVHDETIIEAVKKAGFKIAFSIKKGINDKRTDRYVLKRINVPGGWTGEDIEKAIKASRKK